MIPVTLSVLATVLEGNLQGGDTSPSTFCIEHVVTDSRQSVVAGTLFVALKGQKFDGHDFAAQALAAGAQALLVSMPLPLLNVPQIIVQDTQHALGQWAAWLCQQMPARRVALTGSSGKTTVKEMTAAILQQCGSVCYTESNHNTEIGVAKTLLRLTPAHHFAVVELGADRVGQIAYMGALVKPEAVLVNNLAAAHLAGFGSLAGVAQAKGEIFSCLPMGGTAIINLDSHDLARWRIQLTGKRCCYFSLHSQQADFYATDIQHRPNSLTFCLHTPVGEEQVTLSLMGVHNVANALAAAALAMSLGATLGQVCQGLTHFRPFSGRLFPVELAPGKVILDDSYNANVSSMLAAVQVLAHRPGYRVLVVGDMAELGHEAAACHEQVALAVQASGIDVVLSVGEYSAAISRLNQGTHCSDQKAVVAVLKRLLDRHPTITVLVKGSRSAAMERVIQDLQRVDTC